MEGSRFKRGRSDANSPRRCLCQFGVNAGLVRDQPGDGFAVPRYHDFLAAFDTVEEGSQLVPYFEGVDFGHHFKLNREAA